MPTPRTFDEHLELYAAFARAVSDFDATTWIRIRAFCAAFDEASLLAAFERAQIRALPHGYPTSRLMSTSPDTLAFPLKVLATTSTVIQTGILFAFELSQLVPGLREPAWS